MNLLGGGLEVTGKVKLEVEILDGGAGGLVETSDDGVTPGHQGDLLVVVERNNVGLVEEELRSESNLFGTDIRVLDVLGSLLLVRLLRSASDVDNNSILLLDSHVSGHNGVEHALVDGPDGGPVHGDDVSARALLQHELAESRNGKTTAEDTADGRHTGIIPAADTSGVDNLCKFSFREECLDEVDTGKVPEVDLSEAKSLEEPVVLLVSVGILGRSESVGDALNRVENRDDKIVCGLKS